MKKILRGIIQLLTNKDTKPAEIAPVKIEGVIRNTFYRTELDEIQNYLKKTFEL